MQLKAPFKESTVSVIQNVSVVTDNLLVFITAVLIFQQWLLKMFRKEELPISALG